MQAQQEPLQKAVVEAWRALAAQDRATLAFEMALTGVGGQIYQSCAANRNTLGVGPAFLVYYSPAFLRNAARTNCVAGLQMLAEVYRQARVLWPSSEAAANSWVTLRIDQIKELAPEHIMDGHAYGEAWVLKRSNPQEATVASHPLYSISAAADATRFEGEPDTTRLLAFWWRDQEAMAEEGDSFVAELEHLRIRQRQGSGEAPAALDA